MGPLRSMLPGWLRRERMMSYRTAFGMVAAVGLVCLGMSLAQAQSLGGLDTQAQAALERWVSARFQGAPQAAPAEPYLAPHLDHASRRVLRDSIEGQALLIAGRTFAHGLAMRSTGDVQVVLPQGAP
jgi:hypothetical protein